MRIILFFLFRSRCNFVFCTAVLLSIVLTLTGVLSAATTPQIAGGVQHTIAIKSDETVWAWGYDWSGQLGDGITENHTTPVQVTRLGDVTAIAGGWYHMVALKSDGTVWAWGYNGAGQLGDGTTTN
ncbi:MAG: hypothetical protein HYW13_03105, partial [Planctomycetes bacterium]|nr:hypothetical protein [Planctomycetota bacterium]